MDLQEIINGIYSDIKPHIGQGRVVDYIPELGQVPSNQFGISLALPDGSVFSAGDADVFFSVQSISKVFLLTVTLKKVDEDIWKRINREPFACSFDSIGQLEKGNGVPCNPFVNAGAIVMTDVILEGSSVEHEIENFLNFVRDLANDTSIHINSSVANSEISTGYANIAFANFMRSQGNLKHDVEDVLQVYCHHCALTMNCFQLARSGLYLACRGYNPLTNKKVISEQQTRCLNAIMLTCGYYENSGDFAYRIGFPGKSGVGGGVLAIVPQKASIAVWSPGLTDSGNSLLGIQALELLSARTGWSIFE
ncbi:MAG: glutaminase [Candidatus Liberibacter ctenarytainae]|uniref:Glutaminase n=1 Tax=Candidatus Liberibacter ctenarytainae TaxID=2020335 RepID=A0A937AJT4_9HYPH|nr:glutaminase [Candidatus Liberibacter ctenarytainae]